MNKILIVCIVTSFAFGQTFISHQVTGNSEKIVLVDLDGDTDLDVLSCDNGADQIYWLENIGNGVIERHIIDRTTVYPWTISAVDLDGDGDMDVVTSTHLQYSTHVIWLENDGNESFTHHDLNFSLDFNNIEVCDLDNDDDMDIVCYGGYTWGEGIILLLNDGEESFTHQIISESTSHGVLEVVDFDEDGNLDIIDGYQTGIWWLKNNGDLNFSNDQIGSILGSNTQSLDITDLDEDGDLDIIAGGVGMVTWLENTGAWNYDLTNHEMTLDDNLIRGITTADIDSDADIDIIVAGISKVSWFESDGSSSPNFAVNIISDDGTYFSDVAIADFDGDWDLDVLSSSRYGISWHKSDGNLSPVFNTVQILPSSAPWGGSFPVDIDGDGDIDLLSGSMSNNTLAWHENNGSEIFPIHMIATNIELQSDIYSADMDGDGDLDILAANINSSTGIHDISWYENLNNISFTAHVVTQNVDRPRSVFAIDLDGDGDMDVLSASDDDGKIAWCENDGNELFTDHTISLNAAGANDVIGTDVDSDGDLDVISSSYFDDKIAWYENDGNESFTEHIITPNADGVECISVADVDGDGDMDVLSASSLDNMIAWYENDGIGTFSPHIVSTEINQARSVITMDVDSDNDGYLIILATGATNAPYDEEILWFEYNGDDTFVRHSIPSDVGYLSHVNSADMDGDGDFDIIADGGPGLVWFENTVEMFAGNLNLGAGEDVQHTVSHTPTISWDYQDNISMTQSYYRIEVSIDSNFSSPDIWDTGQVFSEATAVTYSGNPLIDGNTYYLRVMVGSNAFWSQWTSIALRMNTFPTPPIGIAPINNEVILGTTNLQILNSLDAENDLLTYSFQVFSDEGLVNLIDSVTYLSPGEDTTQWDISLTLENNAQYWWVARAFDGYENSLYSEVASFIVDTGNDSPVLFELLQPISMVSINTLTPVLIWSQAYDPDPLDVISYSLYLDTPDPGVEIFNIGTDTSYQVVTALEDNTSYHWKVTASDLYGAQTENTGGYQSFTVNTSNDLPVAFDLLSPVSEMMVTTLTPEFLWELSSDPDDATIVLRESGKGKGKLSENSSSGSSIVMAITGYDFYLGTDAELTDITPVEVMGTSNVPEADLLENQVYYWTVSAVDDSGGVTFSDTASFWTNSVNSVPSELTLLTPVLGTESGVSLTFSWTASEDEDLQDEISYTLNYGPDVFSLISVNTEMNTIFTPEELLLDNTEYIWQVIAEDLSGATYATEFSSFFVNSENDVPSEFNLVGPDSASWITNTDVILVWEPSSDAEQGALDYVVFMGSEESSLVSVDTVSVNYYALQELGDGYYFWQLEAVDELGESQFSEVWTFLINANNDAPDPFSLYTPLDGVVLTEQIPSFIWQTSSPGDSGDHTSYRLILGTSVEDVALIYEGADTSFTASEQLTDNATYFWQVEAKDLAGAITVNEDGYQSFTVNTVNDAPSMASLISPDSVVVLTDMPTFSWNASTDIDPFDTVSYEVHWWFGGGEMDSILTDETTITAINSLTMDNLEYQWEVISMDTQDGLTHSETKSFWVDFMPEVPGLFALTGPDSASAGNGTRPELSWTESIDPDPFDNVFYRVVIATDSLLGNVVYENVAHIETLIPETDLENDTRYYWQVTAIDEDSLITRSDVWTFDVGYLAVDEHALVPEEFTLQQNFPNPFNPSTTIRYGLPEDSNVSLVIYDLRGNVVQTLESRPKTAGWYNVVWNGQTNDGRMISTGIYFARIVAGDYTHVIKMLYLK